MVDYVGLLIGVIVIAPLIYWAFIEKGHREKVRSVDFLDKILKNQISTIKDDLYCKYDNESMRVIDVLESLQPFDYVNRDCISFYTKSSDGILEYRDVLKSKYHGIQGCQLIRQRRLVSIVKDQSCNMFPEWTDIGPVKKEL